ncbi:T9SS type A sorting domain-containing protein [Flavobacterium silvaticum]|uniref:T9SS type A sorting domain-containing protein n=1 Tax=Flavobacterium silvaticum TaxID=1852020 RepID=A0A972JJ18_9FLAO|nr:T9SS type A sorting domain-containing protein [Flavobacterium silvaticum]NMH28888.1 T9SS type A sorting domain-containing protein [Flavobacterium silvaticum]
MVKQLLQIIVLSVCFQSVGQNFNFNFNTTGQRVCLVSAEVDTQAPSVTIKFLDAASNTNHPTRLYRRPMFGNGSDWVLVADAIPAGTVQWTDTNVNAGETWEYQARRTNTWFYAGESHDAIGYTIGSLLSDHTNYSGQVILLVADNIASGLAEKYHRLKKELSGDGWQIDEIIVPKATSWDSGNTVVGIRNQIIAVYNEAPSDDKPKALFILGHVPMPRSGTGSAVAPDEHDQNKGARGCDAYYADVDGIFTDTQTFNPGGLQTPLAINLPGDFKWDQDFFPSDVEMAFGRVDFEDVDDVAGSELTMMETYLDKLHNYKTVAAGWNMGEKSAFFIGYDNSNDGSYRSLPNISKPENVFQEPSGQTHPQWVSQNGPFQFYMQNQEVPDMNQWNTYGMEAAIYSSDQSYWGWNDVPQDNYIYSRIRALLATPTKVVATIWTTTGVNTFQQACSGEPIGFAVREIMNHNAQNNKLERVPQNWDTAAWQNRTHFAFNGDPTIRLYQVPAIGSVTLSEVGNQAVLDWESVNGETIGYHVYESVTEFGKYERLTSAPITGNTYQIADYHHTYWYMVRPVSVKESGCGSFLMAGNGASVLGEFVLSDTEFSSDEITIYPNPAKSILNFKGIDQSALIEVFSIDGRRIKSEMISVDSLHLDLSDMVSGNYLLKIKKGDSTSVKRLIIN